MPHHQALRQGCDWPTRSNQVADTRQQPIAPHIEASEGVPEADHEESADDRLSIYPPTHRWVLSPDRTMAVTLVTVNFTQRTA